MLHRLQLKHQLSINHLLVRRIQLENHDLVLLLLNNIFGPRKGASETLQKWISDPSFSVLGASVDQELSAVSVAHWQEGGAWIKELSTSHLLLGPFLGYKKIGIFQLLAVPPQFRRQGIAEKLATAQLDWMKSDGCVGAIGAVWQHGSGDSSEHLFRKGGFEFLGDLPGFYLVGSRKSHHICPVCHGECHCSARLYGKLF